MAKSTKKVFTSAVVLSPPLNSWEPIQAIRAIHDKAYNRWMPHINLLFPFVPEDEFAQAAEAVANVLKQIQPFEVIFDSFQYFQHAKSCTLYLQPTSKDQIKHLQSLLEKTFPLCNDLSNKSDSGFTPHLSVGQWNSKEIGRAKQNFTQSTLPKITPFTASSIDIISRQGDTPFVVQYSISLGTGNIVSHKVENPTSVGPKLDNVLKLYVGNLPLHMNEDELAKVFQDLGLNVLNATVVKHPSGNSKGFGFVSFATEEDKEKALIAKLSNNIIVKEAK